MNIGVSTEEENRLYAISVVPSVVVFGFFIFYYGFVHLTYLPSGTSIMLDALWNLLVPVFALAPASSFLAYEILTSTKEESAALHLKRFLGRMTIVFIAELFFMVVYLASYFLLAPLISEKFAVLSTLLILLAGLILGLGKFRGFFDRLEKGTWQIPRRL